MVVSSPHQVAQEPATPVTHADSLSGGASNDTLGSGYGVGTMAGGIGDDGYVVDNAGDVIVEAAGEGTDTVTTSLLSYTLGGNVEKLVYSSSKAFTGVGNALGNTITSGSGADLLQGLDGNDTLSSGSGNDTLEGGAGSDVLTGSTGGDVMTGGTGADRFVFTKVSDFGTADLLDRITDFVAADGDRIDIATIDPSSASRNQAFTFIGTAAFTTTTHTTFELRYQAAADGYLLVQGDSNRDGVADFAFLVYATSLSAG